MSKAPEEEAEEMARVLSYTAKHIYYIYIYIYIFFFFFLGGAGGGGPGVRPYVLLLWKVPKTKIGMAFCDLIP